MSGNPWYTNKELHSAGFTSVGSNVRVSRKASLHAITGNIGNNVRIDDFTTLKGRIEIGDYVHISSFCSVSGSRGVVQLQDCSGLSNGVCIYTGSDDYRAVALSNVTVPERYQVTRTGNVTLHTASLIGTHCVLLPGADIGEGASVGALCIVHKPVARGAVVVANGATFTIKGYRDADAIVAMAIQLTGKGSSRK